MRGAGTNFGVILSATYRVHDLTNGGQVMNADMIFPGTANVSFLDIVQSMQDKIPKELSLIASMAYNSTSKMVSTSKSRKIKALTNRSLK